MKGDRLDRLEETLFRAARDGESPAAPADFAVGVMRDIRILAADRRRRKVLDRFLASFAAFSAAAAAAAVFYILSDDTFAAASVAAGLSSGKIALLSFGLFQ